MEFSNKKADSIGTGAAPSAAAEGIAEMRILC